MEKMKDILPDLESFKNEIEIRIASAKEREDHKAVSNLEEVLIKVNIEIDQLTK